MRPPSAAGAGIHRFESALVGHTRPLERPLLPNPPEDHAPRSRGSHTCDVDLRYRPGVAPTRPVPDCCAIRLRDREAKAAHTRVHRNC